MTSLIKEEGAAYDEAGMRIVAILMATCAASAKDLPAAISSRRIEPLRLRGGATAVLDEELRHQLNSWLLQAEETSSKLRKNILPMAEEGSTQLRKKLKPVGSLATGVDAAAAGAVVGFATGKILIGDPKLLAMAGAASFAYAHKYPEKSNVRFRDVANRFADLAHEARTYVSGPARK